MARVMDPSPLKTAHTGLDPVNTGVPRFRQSQSFRHYTLNKLSSTCALLWSIGEAEKQLEARGEGRGYKRVKQ